MTSGRVVGVCVSPERGTSKKNIGKGYLKKGYGLIEDAHAGSSRQVSLLMAERAEEVAEERGLTINPGDLAENITVRGIDLGKVSVGTLLQLGEALVEVVEIGKTDSVPHTFSFHGISLLAAEGVFCNVKKSGRVKVGGPVRVIHLNSGKKTAGV